MSSPRRQEKFAEEIGHLAAEFIERESDGRTLITVTRTEVSPDLKYITVFYSVFPESQENKAVGFIDRKSRDFPDYLAKNARLGRLPHINFKSDKGEARRQHLDSIFRQIEGGGEKSAS